MSSRDAGISTQDSHFVGVTVGNIIYGDFSDWTVDRQVAFADKVDYPVRKTAHAVEYAVLAFLVSGAACYGDIQDKKKRRRLFLCVWGICILYAMSDEIHQAFVPGRAGRISDVCIDAIGSLAGNFIGRLLLWRK